MGFSREFLNELADKYASQVSTSRRVHAEMYIGSEKFSTVSSIVRYAFLAGACFNQGSSLSIEDIQSLNSARSQRWHKGGNWNPMEWAAAMCGEGGELAIEVLALAMLAKQGEAANAAKKLQRVKTDMTNLDTRLMNEELTNREKIDKYREKIGREVADATLYGTLLCEALGISLQKSIRDVFNQKSEEYGFPERL